MTAIETLLAGLFDYAGLYPPAGLGLRSAANNYLDYVGGGHRSALGRFLLNLERVEEFREVAGNSLGQFRLSVIATHSTDLSDITREIDKGLPVEALEIRCSDPAEIDCIARQTPHHLATYFEVPVNAAGRSALQSIAAASARAKIRMGGVVPDAFPSASDVLEMLKSLADLRLAFKATAGLHHPVRSIRPLTYQPQSPTGIMHGFMNLCCAGALLFFDGTADRGIALLEEQDPFAWRVAADSIQWRDHIWTVDQLAVLRSQFLVSIGSCSFEEPIHELESLGWL